MILKIISLMLGMILITSMCAGTVHAQSENPLTEGIKKYQSHSFKDALVYFDQTLQKEPNNKTALDYKGLSLMKLERYHEAEAHYENLIKNYPKDTDMLNNLGITLGALDRHADAIKRFNQVLQINPHDVTALQGAGISYGNLGEYGDSLYYFQTAYDIEPKNIITKNYVEYIKLVIDKYYPKFNTEKSWTIQQKSSSQIPVWIKNNALWWSEDKISESDFLLGIEYLANQGIINVGKSSNVESSKNVPNWIKNNAKWWANGEISDFDFIQGIQFLAENGIIDVPTSQSVQTPQYVVDHTLLDKHLSDVVKTMSKEKRYIEFPNPSWFIKKKYLRDPEKWNLDQTLDSVGTFPDPTYTLENGTYVVHYKIHVNDIPRGIPFDYKKTLDKSLEFWSEQTFSYQDKPLVFDFVYVDRASANVLVAWVVRDFNALGHATLGKGIVEVSMGDYACDGDFQLYDLGTIEYIMRHEIGHSIGLGHSSDPSNIMYPTVQPNYGYCIVIEP